jgi:translation elongation factor EF-G
MTSGTLIGFPMVDVKVTLTTVPTTKSTPRLAFEIAGRAASARPSRRPARFCLSRS